MNKSFVYYYDEEFVRNYLLPQHRCSPVVLTTTVSIVGLCEFAEYMKGNSIYYLCVVAQIVIAPFRFEADRQKNRQTVTCTTVAAGCSLKKTSERPEMIMI